MSEELEKEKAQLEREKQQLQYQKADFERAQDELQAEKDEIEKQKLKLQKLEQELFKKDVETKQKAEAKEIGTKGIIAAINEATLLLFQEDNKLKQKELTLIARESELKQKEQKLKEEQEILKADREKLTRTILGRGRALQILKDLPPPMNIKGKNESYPIVRFSYKQHFHWYKGFINHYKDLCRVLRNIHSSGDISDELKLQIVSVFHYKNFPAKDFADLDIRVNRLVVMLKDIYIQYPHARLMELTRWFENLSYPNERRIPPRPITEHGVQHQLTPIPITQIPEPHFEEEEEDHVIIEDEEEIEEDLAERSESNDEQTIEDRILQEAREQFDEEALNEDEEMLEH